ncbi:TIGR03749 family integrating conjugative element protein [[Pasteurella] aerogenes]
MKINKTALTLLLMTVTPIVSAEVLMQWNRVPLDINLNVNEERIIFVDKNVQVGIPSTLNSKLRVQSSGGAVYLKALDVFDLNRIQLRDLESGQLILLDVRSRNNSGKLENVRLVFNDTVENNKVSVEQTRVTDSLESTPKSNLPIPAALTRYAAQSLYAPLRTVEPLPGVKRMAMKLPKTLPTLLPNLSVRATPLETWGLDNYTVTAVKLQNLETFRVDLDPRYIQGNFYSATFQHSWLGSHGSLEDTTVVYLVVNGSPNQALIAPVTQSNTKQRASKSKTIVKKTISK